MDKLKKIIFQTSHRILLEFLLKNNFKNSLKINKNETPIIVDFGSGKPRYIEYKKNAKWHFFDKNPNHEDVKYSETFDIPISSADLFICIEVLQYLDIDEIKLLLNEACRIIGNKGIAIFSVPYLYPRNHKERLRLSNPQSYEDLLAGDCKFRFQSFGNLSSMIHDILFDFIDKLESRLIAKFLLILIFPLNFLSLLLEKINLLRIPSGYIFYIENNS